MKIIEEINKMIAERKEKIKQQAVENKNIEIQLIALQKEMEEKEQKYIDTLEASILEELEKLKYQYELLERAKNNKENMLGIVKAAKYNLDWQSIEKELNQVTKKINFNGKIEAAEQAKVDYIKALEEICKGAEELVSKFREVAAYEACMSLDIQRNMEKAYHNAFRNTYIKKMENWKEDELMKKLYWTRERKPIFKELDKARDKKAEETGRRDPDSY